MLMQAGPAGRRDSREHDPPLPKEGGETEREKKFGEPGCPRGRRYADRFTLRLEKPVCLIHFGLTIAAMDAAAEIVFSPPAQPCV